MKSIVAFYKVCNVLSLDIVLGSVVCALFFAKIFNVTILLYGICSLALTVWIIYTTDHLLDARSIRKTASSERHRFHQRHFHTLKRIVAIGIFLDLLLIFFMRKPVFIWGVCLAVLVLSYLLLQQYLKIAKEFFVALFYTCGVLLPALAVTKVELNFLYMLVIVQFFLVAWTNLLLFSWFDYEEDRADMQQSFVTISGKRFSYYFINVMAALNFGISVVLWLNGLDVKVIITLMLMQAALILVLSFHQRMKYGIYRLIGDAVFMLPVLYLI